MCCIKWRKTYRKSVSLSQNALEYLAQTSWNKGIWAVVSIVAGNNEVGAGWAALWSFPIHGKLATDDWRIVPPHQDYADSALQLEIKVDQSAAELRLVNKLSNITLTWINFTITVLSQDDPTIQELRGVGGSTVTLEYLPPEGPAESDLTEIESRLDALEAGEASLRDQLAAEIVRIEGHIEEERQARIAMLALVNGLAAQVTNIAAGLGGYWEPVTNGDPTVPEIIFAGGDVVMAWVPA